MMQSQKRSRPFDARKDQARQSVCCRAFLLWLGSVVAPRRGRKWAMGGEAFTVTRH
jgi:hypothetical protein